MHEQDPARLRTEHAAQQQQLHDAELAALEQMWLALARELAEQGGLDAEALAQRLEEHAQRAPNVPGWHFGLLNAAQLLRQGPSSDPDSLVQ